MSAPEIKGWCPGAHRPMMSGDGLVLRIRPRLAEVTGAQMQELCRLSVRYGSGFIDLTNRANLQIRGLSEADHQTVLAALEQQGFLDPSPQLEARRNILMTPFWQKNDLSHQVGKSVLEVLPDLPEMPAKVGIAVDTGPQPLLRNAPADFRFENGPAGLVLRADGADRGQAITPEQAPAALIEMAQWFARNRGEHRRMAPFVAKATPPAEWNTANVPAPAPDIVPGPCASGTLLGVAFGQIDARALADLITRHGIETLRVTPWRMLLADRPISNAPQGFILDAANPLLRINACAGAPFCPQASVETQGFARQLAPHVTGSLHVSGCSKGCAMPTEAQLCLVGRDGKFDLVRHGKAWDAPVLRGKPPQDILAEIDAIT